MKVYEKYLVKTKCDNVNQTLENFKKYLEKNGIPQYMDANEIDRVIDDTNF